MKCNEYITDFTGKELSICYMANYDKAIDFSQSLKVIQDSIIVEKAYLETASFGEIVTLSRTGMQSLLKEYQASPETFDETSPKFNPEKIDGIGNGIPAEKFAGFDRTQCWYIRRAIEYGEVDPTIYITPEDSYRRIFAVCEILQEGKFSISDFSDGQLDRLAEALFSDSNNQIGYKLMDPKFSIEEMDNIIRLDRNTSFDIDDVESALQEIAVIEKDQAEETVIKEFFIKNYGTADNLSGQVLQNLIREYQELPEIFDKNSPEFNPEKIQGIKEGIPAEKFAGMNWSQSWLVRTNIIHHNIDITAHVTPESSYSEMFTVGLIMQKGFKPEDFSKEQIATLSNVLVDEHHTNEKLPVLINPAYSPDDIKYLKEYIDCTQDYSPDKLTQVLNAREKIQAIEFAELMPDSGVYTFFDNKKEQKTEFNTSDELLQLLEPYDTEGKIDKLRLNGSIELSNGATLDVASDSVETIALTMAHELKQPGIEVLSNQNVMTVGHDVDFN